MTIEHQEDESGGSFWLQLLTRNGVGVRPDSNALPIDLGSGAQAFLQGVIASVRANEGKASLRPSLLGHRAPDRQAACRTSSGTSLARSRRRSPRSRHPSRSCRPRRTSRGSSRSCPTTSPSSTRRRPGSWARRPTSVAGSSASRRPRVPPPAALGVATIAVISGVFTGPATLEEAEAEADALEYDVRGRPDPGRRPGGARVPRPHTGLRRHPLRGPRHLHRAGRRRRLSTRGSSSPTARSSTRTRSWASSRCPGRRSSS